MSKASIDRQPERDVHRCVEGDELDRDVALVVVLRDDEVEGAVVSSVVECIGRNRPDHVDPLRPGGSDGGREIVVVLGSEQPALSAMRFKPLDTLR